MERNHKPQAKEDARMERDKVKLDRRYGKIGISAVAAALQPSGARREPASGTTALRCRPDSSTHRSTPTVVVEAAGNQVLHAELAHVAESSRVGGLEAVGRIADVKAARAKAILGEDDEAARKLRFQVHWCRFGSSERTIAYARASARQP